MVGKSKNLSVKHTAEGSIWYITEHSFSLLALTSDAHSGQPNFAPPTQDASVTFPETWSHVTTSKNDASLDVRQPFSLRMHLMHTDTTQPIRNMLSHLAIA
jgi:hypothetical protein